MRSWSSGWSCSAPRWARTAGLIWCRSGTSQTGTELISWTYAKSQKAKNLERDPRATVGIETGVQYHELRGVTFECDVELEREPERVETLWT